MKLGIMLDLMEKLGMDVLMLTSALSEEEFFSSRLAYRQTTKLLDNMCKTAASLPKETKNSLHEIDWAAWASLPTVLARAERHPLKLWVAVQELTPLTVHRLKQYRRQHPKLFSVVP